MITVNGEEYTTFSDVWRESVLTDVEKEEILLKVELMGKLIEAREEQGLTQGELAQLCGVKQPYIARLEKGGTDPQITTFLKVLKPLGYTLAIVPRHKVSVNSNNAAR